MLEFRKYPPETPPEERKGSPVCVVKYPETCGEAAVGEVWDLPFCPEHGGEAHAAACLEAYEDAGRELDAFAGLVEGGHAVINPLVREALEAAELPGGVPNHDHGEYIRAAYDLAAAPPDPDTLAHDYDDDSCGGPYDWWSETREMVVGFMREAHGAFLPHLVEALEPLRERASVQQEVALEDMERRYVAPLRAAREERKRREAGDQQAE